MIEPPFRYKWIWLSEFQDFCKILQRPVAGCEGETVSQHRSPVVLLRFGDALEGRRLRRPRYRGEQSPLLGIGEAPGGASACICLAYA